MDTLKRIKVPSCRQILPLWEVLYCILSTKGMFVLFHGLRKWENSVELDHFSNSPPAWAGCPWWLPPLPPLPEDSGLKAHNLALEHLPKPMERLMPTWELAEEHVGSAIKYTHKQIRRLKMPFCSLLAAVTMLIGSNTASERGRVQTSFFTQTSHLL